MRFLYTGASAYNTKQDNPLLSLGGYISNTIVPNDRINNLFSDISYVGFLNKSQECKAFILENETGITAHNVRIGYKYPTNRIFKMEVAFVGLNPSAPQQIERIPSSFDAPYYAEFVEANIDTDDDPDNSVDIGNLVAGGRIAVWFKRNIIEPATIDDYFTYYKQLSQNPENTSKKIQLIIKYQIDQ